MMVELILKNGLNNHNSVFIDTAVTLNNPKFIVLIFSLLTLFALQHKPLLSFYKLLFLTWPPVVLTALYFLPYYP